MAELASLKVPQAPAALAPTAAAHNRLVDLVNNIVGQNGVQVTISEGRILIEFDQATAGNRPTGLGGGGGGDSGTPTELHGTSGAISVDIAAGAPGGVQVNNSGTRTVYMTGSGFSVTSATSSMLLTEATFLLSAGGHSLNIDSSLFTHDITLREIDVCDGGVAKKMLVLASAPY